jgi:hypothetical protein
MIMSTKFFIQNCWPIRQIKTILTLSVLTFFKLSVSTFALVASPIQAHAYIGPGMGLGAAATVLGLFAAVILLIVGLIWLPIRRLLRNRKKDKEANKVTSP